MTDIARLILDVDTLGLRNAERELNRFGGAARGVADIVQKAFAAIGVGLGIAEVIRINSEFGASMSKVAAISGATGAEFDKLREKALEMGAATQFSASQAADALGFLAMAGFSVAEAIEAIPGVLSLAAAAGMDLAEAADIASNVLSGFGKNAKDAGEVADVLAKAASVSNTNVSQLGQALSTAAPIAAALGISMEETAAAIGVMSDAGIQGERAGTALRGVFASLAGPTTQARDALANYGLTAAQIDPQTVGLTTAMATLRDANISTADAFVIFGREAASGALVMAETADRVRDLTGQFQNSDGAAEAMAATMRDNLQGDIQSLKSAMEGLVIALGDSGVTGAFRSMAQFATEAVRMLGGNMGTLINVVASAVTGWVAYRTVLLVAQGATLLMNSTLAFNLSVLASTRTALGTAAAAQTAFGIATSTAAGIFRGFTAALIANPFTAVAVAVGALAAAMMGLSQAQAQARAETDNLVRSLRGLAQARSADFALARAEVDVERMRAEDRITQIRARQNQIRGRAGLSAFSQEAGEFKRLEEEARGLIWRVIELEGELGAADMALQQANKAAESMVVPVAEAATVVSGLGDELGKTKKAANDNDDALRAVEDRFRTMAGAARQLRGDVSGIFDRLFPDEARFRRSLEDVGALLQGRRAGLVTQEGFERAGEQILDDTAPDSVKKVSDAVEEFKKEFLERSMQVKKETKAIAESFAQMSRQITGSLQGLANSIRSGDILGILGGVLDIFTSLGSAGVFGQGLADRLNAPATVAPTNKSMGGPVYTGNPYIVGENGPELFTPPGSGRIVSNDNMAQNVHVTVGIDPRSGNVLAFVDGRIAATGPVIANAGAQQAQAQAVKSARRTVRR